MSEIALLEKMVARRKSEIELLNDLIHKLEQIDER